MSMTITGTVKAVLDEVGGTSNKGPWRKREFILVTPGEYPDEVCIVQWGDNIDQQAVHQGETITAHIDIASREYNGRWYTDVKAWKIERDGEQATAPVAAPSLTDPDDTLPF